MPRVLVFIMLALAVACTPANRLASPAASLEPSALVQATAVGQSATASSSPPPGQATPGTAPASPMPQSTASAEVRPASLPLLLGVELQAEDPMPGGQFVWILNRSGDTLDLGCWALQSYTTGKTMRVEPGLVVPAEAGAVLTPAEAWLGTVDQVQLLDRTGRLVDQTPELRDTAFDDQIWFRASGGDWQFGRTGLSQEVVHGHMTGRVPSGC